MTNWKEEKKYFEANILDGNKVEDCGHAMVSSMVVWDVIKEILSKRNEEIREMVRDAKVSYLKSEEGTSHGDYSRGYNAAIYYILSLLPKEPQESKEDEESPYCKVCGGCGITPRDGITSFLKHHVKGKTNCKNEASFIADIVDQFDEKPEPQEQKP